MTINDRMLLELADLKAVRFDCAKCGTGVIPPGELFETGTQQPSFTVRFEANRP